MPFKKQDIPVLDEVRKWQQQGARLREMLLEERVAISARLEEINAALDGIPDLVSAFLAQENATTVVGEASSAPDIVSAIVNAHPEGISGQYIIQEAQSIKPTLEIPLIHSTISRLIKKGGIVAEGMRGNKTYYPPSKTTLPLERDVTQHNQLLQMKEASPTSEQSADLASNKFEGFTQAQILQLVDSAVQVMTQLDEPMTPFHIDTIVKALENEGWKIGEKEKATLIDELTQLSEEDRGVYAGADDDTFGIVKQKPQNEGEDDLENDTATP